MRSTKEAMFIKKQKSYHHDQTLMVVFFSSMFDYLKMKLFYIDLAVSHPIKAFFLAAPQRYR